MGWADVVLCCCLPQAMEAKLDRGSFNLSVPPEIRFGYQVDMMRDVATAWPALLSMSTNEEEHPEWAELRGKDSTAASVDSSIRNSQFHQKLQAVLELLWPFRQMITYSSLKQAPQQGTAN
jgi:hypothetical protein